MTRALAREKAEAFNNLKLDGDFFNRMLKKCEDGGEEEFRDFDVFLMEKSVMPLLLQGLDALSRHVHSLSVKAKDGTPADKESKLRFNPLSWLAQYLLRNHPNFVKDHRTPMYERFSELANIEKGRRCLLRRRDHMESEFRELCRERNSNLKVDDVFVFFQRLDSSWHLEGALVEKLPKDYSKLDIPTRMAADGSVEMTFEDFWTWFETFVKTSDIIRASAFIDAERRQLENEEKARKAEENAERRERAMQEAMEQRAELEEQFETVTADMYINVDIARIMSKGAVIDGVEEKEGGPPLQGEHIALIRCMLTIWGCPIEDNGDEDVWNDSALAAWQQWLQSRNLPTSRPVDKQTIRRLIDKDEFDEYLQHVLVVTDPESGADLNVRQIVELRGFVDEEDVTFVEAIDEETGETIRLAVHDHEIDEIRQRLETATPAMPLLASADRVSGRIVQLMSGYDAVQ